MNVLLVSCGAIGLRHLANLRKLHPAAHITVLHQHTQPGGASAHPPEADRVVYTLEEACRDLPHAALINSPASRHIDTALALARNGVHLFIEKPMSHTLDGVDELLALCRERNLALMIAYPFRYYRPLQVMRQAIQDGRIGRILSFRAEVGQYLPDWRPGKDYRESVSARAELGGGAVLELSHEIDYLRWLAGEVTAVTAQLGHVSNLEIDVEDVAEIVLRLQNGALGSIHVDMIQRVSQRVCKIIGSEGTICWDGGRHSVQLYSAAAGAWTDLVPAHPYDRNEMYLDELKHFLDCAAGNGKLAADPAEAKRVLEIALAIKASAASGALVKL